MNPTNRYACNHCRGHMTYEGAPTGAMVDCPHCGSSTVLDGASVVMEPEEEKVPAEQPSQSLRSVPPMQSKLSFAKKKNISSPSNLPPAPDLPPPPGSDTESRHRSHTSGNRSGKSSGSLFIVGLCLLPAWPLAAAAFYFIFSPNKETDTYIWMLMMGLFSFFFFAMASNNARSGSHDLLHWLILLSVPVAALAGYYPTKMTRSVAPPPPAAPQKSAAEWTFIRERDYANTLAKFITDSHASAFRHWDDEFSRKRGGAAQLELIRETIIPEIRNAKMSADAFEPMSKDLEDVSLCMQTMMEDSLSAWVGMHNAWSKGDMKTGNALFDKMKLDTRGWLELMGRKLAIANAK